MFKYSTLHEIIQQVLGSNAELSSYQDELYRQYISYMSNMNVNMNVDNDITTNRNLIVYLANFFNFLEQNGYQKITLNTTFDEKTIKLQQDQIVEEFFDRCRQPNGNYRLYGHNFTEKQKEYYASNIKRYGMQFVKDLEPEFTITTNYSYNGGTTNPTRKVGVEFSSPLSAGLVNPMEINQLVKNIVFEKLDSQKIKSYGNVTDISAICSSSSSSSSSAFIAYMKLA